MFNGLYVHCYYHPKGNIVGQNVIERGSDTSDICSACDIRRSACSRILTSLCGLGKCIDSVESIISKPTESSRFFVLCTDEFVYLRSSGNKNRLGDSLLFKFGSLILNFDLFR